MTKTTQEFVQEFKVLSGAGIGVLIIQTREPYRTQDVLQKIAYEKQKAFKVWDIVNGWAEYPEDSTKEPEYTICPDVMKAASRMKEFEPDDENYPLTLGVMHYPHWLLGKHPALIQLLKQYVNDFASNGQRLCLLVPEGFTPPPELQNDVTVMDFPLPTNEEIGKALSNVTEDSLEGNDEEKKQIAANIFAPDERETLVSNASGMTQLEAENSFSRAIMANIDTWPETSFEAFNTVLLGCKTDVVKRSEVLELMEPVSFDQVGGLDLFKEYVSKRKRAFTSEAREAGVDTPKGIMLVGPPGTGKSLCAKAISSELGLPLIGFDISRVYAGIVGESEAKVKASLKQLDAMAPCIAFVDEVDKALGGAQNGGGDSGVSQRVLGAILTHMQESPAPVYWVFTANRHDMLDPALIRKGRLDENFCVTLPNIIERLEIIKIHLTKRKQDPDKIVGLKKAVAGSKGFVSAEIEAAVAESVNEAFHSGQPITGDSILAQLTEMRPLAEAFPDDFKAMMEWAENNAKLTSSPDEDASEVKVRAARPNRRKLDTKNS